MRAYEVANQWLSEALEQTTSKYFNQLTQLRGDPDRDEKRLTILAKLDAMADVKTQLMEIIDNERTDTE